MINELEIKEGGTASNTFLSMVNGSFKGYTEKTRSQLIEYCKLDTYAMVKILERLYKVWVRHRVFGLYIDIKTKLKKENRFCKTHPSNKIKWCNETFWVLHIMSRKAPLDQVEGKLRAKNRNKKNKALITNKL